MNIGNQLVCITTKSTQEISYVQHTYVCTPLPITPQCAIVHCTSSVLSLFSGCFSSTKGHPPHSEVTQVVKRVREHNYYDYMLCMYLSTYVRTYIRIRICTCRHSVLLLQNESQVQVKGWTDQRITYGWTQKQRVCGGEGVGEWAGQTLWTTKCEIMNTSEHT